MYEQVILKIGFNDYSHWLVFQIYDSNIRKIPYGKPVLFAAFKFY